VQSTVASKPAAFTAVESLRRHCSFDIKRCRSGQTLKDKQLIKRDRGVDFHELPPGLPVLLKKAVANLGAIG